MKILITGSAGFIGTPLCNLLRLRGEHEIVEFDLVYGDDIRDADLLEKLMQGVETVVHLAAISSVSPDVSDEEIIDTNCIGTLNVLKEAVDAGVNNIIFASSAAVNEQLGIFDYALPISIYGSSKLSGEHYCKIYSDRIKTCVLRFQNVFGPGNTTGVIARLIYCALTGETFHLKGTGLQTRDFIHVYEVCRSIEEVINRGITGTHNVGSGKSVSINNLISYVQQATSRDIKIETEPYPSSELLHSKIESNWFSRYQPDRLREQIFELVAERLANSEP